MAVLKALFSKRFDLADWKLTKEKKVKGTKPCLLKDVMETPEKFKLEAVIENEEIVITIKRRES